MFGKKAKRIKELETRVAELERLSADTLTLQDNYQKTLKTVEALKALRAEDISHIKALSLENENLKSKLNANRVINKALQKKNGELTNAVEHTKKVNRDRQRRFREAHKAA